MYRNQLIQKAKAAGLTITTASERIHLERKGSGATSVIIYGDGTILRSDVDLTLSKRLTPAQAAKHLGL